MAIPVVPLIALGLPVLQQIIGLFHKDDPSSPTLDVAQAPQMIMQQLLPMIIMVQMMDKKDDGGGDMLPLMMLMMMQGGGLNTGAIVQPATQSYNQAFTTAFQNMAAMQKQVDDLQAMFDAMSKGEPLPESPKQP